MITTKRRRWVRAVWGWDLVVSLLVSVVFLWFVLSSDRPLEDAHGVLVASIPFGVTIVLGVLVAARWLSDRLKDDPYGELLRSVDPDESSSQAPFAVVATAGLATSCLGVLLLLIQGEVGRALTAISYAALLFLAVYSLLGFADLILLLRRHQRRQAKLRSIQEKERRRQDE